MEELINWLTKPDTIFGFGLLLAVLTFLVLLRYLRVLLRALKTKHWPQVPGRWERLRIKEGISSESQSRGQIQYALDLEYSYQIGERRHLSQSRFLVGEPAVDKADSLEAFIHANPEEASIQVYYDPKRPTDSVLTPGLHSIYYTPIIVSFVFVLVGVALMILAIFIKGQAA